MEALANDPAAKGIPEIHGNRQVSKIPKIPSKSSSSGALHLNAFERKAANGNSSKNVGETLRLSSASGSG
jgi:hypothetical protein